MTCHVKVPEEQPGEVIKPWAGHLYQDNHGLVVTTAGVEMVKQWVLFYRPDYEPVCFCPRRDWSNKFRKVSP